MDPEERLGRYILQRRLASGGMAEIFLAEQLQADGTRRICCVKRMLPELSEDTSFVEMFLDEARVCARLSHKGIAQILDFGKEGNSYFLAMEYVDGASLHTVLDVGRERRMLVPVSAAARLISLAAIALDYAHHAVDEHGQPMKVIHRDVSPHNIMLSARGDVKIIDFGIAKAADAIHRTAIGTLKGKFAYMAPEQLHHREMNHRVDIYALGLVLYELLAGAPAVQGSSHAALLTAAHRRTYPPLDRIRGDIPAGIQAILDKALQLEPAERYQTAADLSEALEEFLASAGLTVKPSHLIALLPDPERETGPDEDTQGIHNHDDKTTAERPKRISQLQPRPAIDDDVAPTLPPMNREPDEVATPLASFAVRRSLDLELTDPVRAAPDIAKAMARPPKNAEPPMPAHTVLGPRPTVAGSLPLPNIRPSPTVEAPTQSRTANIVLDTDPVREAPDIEKAMRRSPSSKNPAAAQKVDITPVNAPPAVERKRPRRFLRVMVVLVLMIIVGVEVIALTGAAAPIRATLREHFGETFEKLGLGGLVAP